MGDAAVTYSLKYQARVLTSLPSDSVNSKWIVGTTALREENEIRVLQYDPDTEQLVCKQSVTHSPEVWDIAPCPTREDLLVTVWAKNGNGSATLWRLASDGSQLEQQAEMPGQTAVLRSALWGPQQPDVVVTLEEGFLRKWAVADGGVEAVATCPAGEMVQLWSGALHPRNPSLLCTAGSNDVQTWDLRALGPGCRPSGEIKHAHKMPVRSISFAPHADTRILTAGDDSKLRFWDLRSPGQPLMELGSHRHWVWRALYNPMHDALVASCSSDCAVHLHYTPHLAASAGPPGAGAVTGPAGAQAGAAVPGQGSTAAGPRAQGALDSAAGQAAAQAAGKATSRAGASGVVDMDGKVVGWDEHEDSVYGLAWSAADPWLLASLSLDGRVALNKVPKNIKYKILI